MMCELFGEKKINSGIYSGTRMAFRASAYEYVTSNNAENVQHIELQLTGIVAMIAWNSDMQG